MAHAGVKGLRLSITKVHLFIPCYEQDEGFFVFYIVFVCNILRANVEPSMISVNGKINSTVVANEILEFSYF